MPPPAIIAKKQKLKKKKTKPAIIAPEKTALPKIRKDGHHRKNLKIKINIKKLAKNSVSAVTAAAAKYEYFGMKIKFAPTLKTAAAAYIQISVFCLDKAIIELPKSVTKKR